MLQFNEVRPFRPLLPPHELGDVDILQDSGGYIGAYGKLAMMVTERKEFDGRWWRHASLSRKDRSMPSFNDLKTLKRIAFGTNRWAVQVFPSDEEYVDIGTKIGRPIEILHLWGCESSVLPDFRQDGHI